jgi:hypothetical protein
MAKSRNTFQLVTQSANMMPQSYKLCSFYFTEMTTKRLFLFHKPGYAVNEWSTED